MIVMKSHNLCHHPHAPTGHHPLQPMPRPPTLQSAVFGEQGESADALKQRHSYATPSAPTTTCPTTPLPPPATGFVTAVRPVPRVLFWPPPPAPNVLSSTQSQHARHWQPHAYCLSASSMSMRACIASMRASSTQGSMTRKRLASHERRCMAHGQQHHVHQHAGGGAACSETCLPLYKGRPQAEPENSPEHGWVDGVVSMT